MPLNAWDGAFIGVMTVSGSSEDVPQRVRLAWVELNCFTCGEVAGFIENQRIVRPVYSGGIRLERGRPRCGRCGECCWLGRVGSPPAVPLSARLATDQQRQHVAMEVAVDRQQHAVDACVG